MANTNKTNDWKTFLPTQTSSKESFTLIVQYPGTTPVQYFPKLKNPDGSNVIGEDGRPQYRTDIYNYDITARSSAQILTKAEQLIR